jgi:hypothetical protein
MRLGFCKLALCQFIFDLNFVGQHPENNSNIVEEITRWKTYDNLALLSGDFLASSYVHLFLLPQF